ncbi:hypothetical protein GWK08_11955 [Leptobacterium flavescens]|uniref:Threonine synthase n=1 Tax=Leptobacterium flavescens TaxID=472055 RepID=A0A6P0UQQ7_9FLAO|nr:DUF6503 family protein [Leptobacterium flavescens]NER14159.1 hypothetical protein [Leptobacterium flavescens]
MKKASLLLLIVVLFAACKETKTTEKEVVEVEKEIQLPDYPQEIAAVFDKHGGIRNWKSMRSMSYEIVKPGGNEKQTIDLVSRNDLIETEKYTMGFDGKDSWIKQDSAYYRGNPRFYHNLIFYFYAMPFVLGDDGIKYEKAEDLVYEGVNYPGFKISYESNIGDSPDDNYYIYYNAEDNTMAWLGYTVTYGRGEANDNVHYIRYNDWKEFDGLVLPNSITWFVNEGSKLVQPRNTVNFANVTVSKERPDASIFAKPEGAVVAEK